MLRAVIAAVLLCMLAAVASCQQQTGTVLYVATNGNDQWSGKLAAPNAEGSDGPFATIPRARDAIRELKSSGGGLREPVTVYLRGGTYFLSEPVVFAGEDSGTTESPITYTAYEKEKAVLSGGVAIAGWRSAELNGRQAWAAQLPAVAGGQWYFKQLFVNGARRPRSRLPREGTYRFGALLQPPRDIKWNQGQKAMLYAGRDIRPWRNLSDVEIIAVHFWIEEHLPIANVDASSNIVTFTRPSLFRMTAEQNPTPASYFIENVMEAVDTPGQWYLDRGSGTLYYLPQPGETPEATQVVAPRLTTIIHFKGSASQPVAHISLRGLSVMHNQWDLPPDTASYKQAAVNVPAAILFQGAQQCSIRNCAITHIGTYAVELRDGCSGNSIVGNEISDLGAGGVKLHFRSERTVVSDNHIFDGGRIFISAVGVWVGNSAHNEVSHNLIHHFYYTGVSVGWTWGYRATPTQDNHIEYNIIHHIGLGMLDDLGGIYTLGVQPGTVLRNNFIRDVSSASNRGRGIYLDEGSSGILVENNIVLRTDDAAIIQNYGRDAQIQNNIFCLGKVCQIKRGQYKGEGQSFNFQRNIFYYTDGDMLGGQWGDGNYAFDYNVYYNAGGRPVTFAGDSFNGWQGSGMDQHGVVADPRLSGLSEDKPTLGADSPALSLGFKPIDVSQMGPRGAVGVPSG